MTISCENFKKTLGQFVTGVAVITSLDPSQQPVGITINSLTSVSLDPPLILFCLKQQSPLLKTFKNCSHFAANILTLDQTDLSNLFAKNNANKWDLVAHKRHQKFGIPILKDTQATIICKTDQQYPGGDHEIIFGEVIELSANPNKSPLVYFQGQYTHI